MCILLNFHPVSCVNLAPNKYKQERIISIHPLFIKMHSSLRANQVKESRPWSTNRHNMLSHPNSEISCWQRFLLLSRIIYNHLSATKLQQYVHMLIIFKMSMKANNVSLPETLVKFNFRFYLKNIFSIKKILPLNSLLETRLKQSHALDFVVISVQV